MITKEDAIDESQALDSCPFCGGKAEFYLSKNTNASLCIRHWPDKGIVCPARFDQYCENWINGRNLWNKRY